VGNTSDRQYGYGLTLAVTLFVMTWDNIINVFFQPWVDARSDSTWNRSGLRKPWHLLRTHACDHDSKSSACS
jgi:hypothetical protein